MTCGSAAAFHSRLNEPAGPWRVLVHTLHDEGSTTGQVRATTLEPTLKMRMVWSPDALTGDETACHAVPLTEAKIFRSGEYARNPPFTTTAPSIPGPLTACDHV